MLTTFYQVEGYAEYLWIYKKSLNKMTPQQEDKITELIRKYNDILLISMRLAVAEDFLNLLIDN